MSSSPTSSLRVLRHYRADMVSHAEDCLYVVDKDGKEVTLIFNKAQRYLHARLEKLLREKGMIRVLVLKGRQQGISTYVAARYYSKASLRKGTRVYILAHEQAATDNLFRIVDYYQQRNPIAPHVGDDNAKTLSFDKLNSRYTVATAGPKAGGRSQTNRLFHGSEVPRWTNAKEHFAASVETVPDSSGTEIILEGTAHGVNNVFYTMWQDAIEGKSEYTAIFIPWFWQDEYWAQPEQDFKLRTEEEWSGEMTEVDTAETFGLNDGQMQWRRNKIKKMGIHLFNQEYPCTAEMAFISSDKEAYISPIPVLKAIKREVEGSGPLIIGVDPAGEGGDRFAVCARRGHSVEWIKWRNKVSTNEALVWLQNIVDEHEPDRLNVDAGSMGSAIISAFRDLGPKYRKVIHSVNFGATSECKIARPHAPGPKNRRAEMWRRMKEWLELEEGVSLPNIDVLQRDISSVRRRDATNNDLLLESKDAMRRRGVRSPDLADALALTFAYGGFIKAKQTKPKTKSFGEPEVQGMTHAARFRDAAHRRGWMS